MKLFKKINLLMALALIGISMQAQNLTEMSVEGNVDNLPVREYTLTINQEIVNKADKDVMGMTVNGNIPGPTLTFNEGEYAVIYVTNNMDVETSVHWHGLLLPNFYDGVPYLSTPPIEPGKTFKYEFPIKQAGTYWYHSHTLLQEQSGVFGSIVIHPKEETLVYDKELVMILSDWTNDKPMSVLRFLKRGTSWYQWRKGTSTPLNQVIARGALGAQLNFWKQRMESTDIADIYYNTFLVNGEQSQQYPDFKPGERVRLRIINGAASTQFWMTFGGGDPTLVAADGLNVEPVKRNKTFIAIAETYDFIVTIPENGKIELKSTAQDGSGTSSAFIGEGKTLAAAEVPQLDKIGLMKKMSKMNMRMGAPALKFRPNKVDPQEMADRWGMQPDKEKKKEMKGMDMRMGAPTPKNRTDSEKMEQMSGMDMDGGNAESKAMDHTTMNMSDENASQMQDMPGMDLFSEYNYDYLKSPKKTAYADNVPVKEILLNLTGNMSRYIWSMNGVPLAEADKIKIKGDQVTRITLNNLTMMHHPMHLHGHFFRVLNENGEYSPLKHTVNVPAMQKVTIEFYGNEYGDWFFHCHILYHLMGGMNRVISYDTPRDPRLKEYPVSKLVAETNKYYSWGLADVASNNTALFLTTSNIRNQFNLSAEYGWNKNMEAEFSYEYYLYDYLRFFWGVNVENTTPDSLDEMKTVGVAGIRWFTPYMFNVDVRVDSELRTRIGIGRSLLVFPKFSIFGYYEYQLDAGIVNDLGPNVNYEKEVLWNAGAQYLLSKNFSIIGTYDTRFGAGGGLSIMF